MKNIDGKSSQDFEWCPEMSMLISFITWIANGFNLPLGLLPALSISALGPRIIRANPSAIWLRAEFAIQRKRIFIFSSILSQTSFLAHIESIAPIAIPAIAPSALVSVATAMMTNIKKTLESLPSLEPELAEYSEPSRRRDFAGEAKAKAN